MADSITVEVAYARPERQWLLPLSVPAGTTVRKAIEQSGILAQCPEIDLGQNRVGIFGREARLEQVLNAGERVEIYRPLLADPKDVRRRLAAQGKTMGRKRPAG